MAAAGILSRYITGTLPNVGRHITGNKMCSIKTFISLLTDDILNDPVIARSEVEVREWCD